MARTTVVHMVASLRPHVPHLRDDAMYLWLWRHLRAAFPDAIAIVLMPNHLHLLAWLTRLSRRRLAAVLGGFARTFELGEIWRPVPEPEAVVSDEKLARNVRYTALNPCRTWQEHEPLVRDPLAWPWSTHRDVVGAIVNPWIAAPRLADVLGWPAANFAQRYHRYVSSDSHVATAGTPFPLVAPASSIPQEPLERLLAAASAATRAPAKRVQKRSPTRAVFLGLARRQGWQCWERLAKICAMQPNWCREAALRCPASWLEAGALCLGDARLVGPPIDLAELEAVRGRSAIAVDRSIPRFSARTSTSRQSGAVELIGNTP